MDQEVRKHLRGIRILVTLALLAACLSFAFSYVLFRDVNIPLERMVYQELNALDSKVDTLLSSRLNGRMDLELQMALQSMEELKLSGPKQTQAQAQKAIDEAKALLQQLRQLRAGGPPKVEAAAGTKAPAEAGKK